MDKVKVGFLVEQHWTSIARNPYSGEKQRGFLFAYVFAPLLLGGTWAAAVLTTDLAGEGLGGSKVLTAVSILVGFLFGLLIWVFQLRRDYEPSHFVNTDADIPQLLDQLFSNTCYAVLVSGVTVGASLPSLRLPEWVSSLGEGAMAALLVHLGLTLLLLVRRTAIAYAKLAKEKDDERKALSRNLRGRDYSA